MARNRKHQSAALRFGPVLKAFLLCTLIGGAAVGYVWQKDQIKKLGDQFTQREIRLKQLERENIKRSNLLDQMRTPGAIEARIKDLKLGLSQAPPSQVLVLPEPVSETAPVSLPRPAAAGQTTAMLR